MITRSPEAERASLERDSAAQPDLICVDIEASDDPAIWLAVAGHAVRIPMLSWVRVQQTVAAAIEDACRVNRR